MSADLRPPATLKTDRTPAATFTLCPVLPGWRKSGQCHRGEELARGVGPQCLPFGCVPGDPPNDLTNLEQDGIQGKEWPSQMVVGCRGHQE